jgi:hypothetical protein
MSQQFQPNKKLTGEGGKPTQPERSSSYTSHAMAAATAAVAGAAALHYTPTLREMLSSKEKPTREKTGSKSDDRKVKGLADAVATFAVIASVGSQRNGLAVTEYKWSAPPPTKSTTTTVMCGKYLGYILDNTQYPRLNRLKVQDLYAVSCFVLDFNSLNSSDVSDLVYPNLSKICVSAVLLAWVGSINSKFGIKQYKYFMLQIGSALFYIYKGSNNKDTFNSNVENYDANTTLVTIYNDSMREHQRNLQAYEALCKYAFKYNDTNTLNSVWTMFCSDPRWYDAAYVQGTYTLCYPNLVKLIKEKNIALWNIIPTEAPGIDDGFQCE